MRDRRTQASHFTVSQASTCGFLVRWSQGLDSVTIQPIGDDRIDGVNFRARAGTESPILAAFRFWYGVLTFLWSGV